MNKTKHFGLILPKQDDFYDIDIFNENSKRIDALLHELEQKRPKTLIATYLTSGVFRPADYGLAGKTVDVYMVGGGAGAAGNLQRAGGGGGGFCKLLRDVALDQESYNIIIGSTGTISGSQGGNGGLGGGGAGASFGDAVPGGNGGQGLVYIYARKERETQPKESPLAQLSQVAYAALVKECQEKHKAIGILQNGICIDVAVFPSVETAQTFLKSALWPEADTVAALQEGRGIGDTWDGKAWCKQTVPDEEEASA